jgi:hypothetical protein
MQAALGFVFFVSSGQATAEFLQITGPTGSVGCGTRVAVLPNGNVESPIRTAWPTTSARCTCTRPEVS